MADERISSFITDEALAELQTALSSLKDISAQVAAMNSAAKQAEGFAKQAASVEELVEASEQLVTVNGKIVSLTGEVGTKYKQTIQIMSALNGSSKEMLQVENQRLKNQQEVLRIQKLQDTVSKEATRQQQQEAKIAADLANSYGLLSKAYNDAALRAKNMQIELGKNHPLAVQATADAKRLADELKRLDASVGQNQRNVGNYSSATAGLNLSIQQIARELPSLSNGMATFFSAIGNNIAPAVDAFQAFRKEQEALKASGQPTVSAFQALAGSVFNLQTGLLLAVTALTVYGKDIVQYVFNTKQAADETKRLVSYVDELGDALAENNDLLLTEGRLNIARAKARGASIQELASIEQKGFDDRIKAQQAFINESIENETFYAQQLDKIQGGIKLNGVTEADAQKNLDAARAQTQRLTQQRKQIESEKELAKLQAIIDENSDKKKIKVKDLTNEFNKLRDTIREISIELANPDQKELSGFSKQIDDEIKGWENLFKAAGAGLDKQAADAANKLAGMLRSRQQQKLNDETDFQKKWDAIIKKASDINEAAQILSRGAADVSNLLAQRRIDEIDAEIKKINERRDAEILAIEASSMSEDERRKATAAANARADAEERRLEADKLQRKRRAAAFDKGVTIAQIIANTSLAVIKAYTEGDPYTKVARAILAGAAGAAALATAVAAPLPQYEEGTDFHPGGKAVLFEKGKTEAVIEPGKPVWFGNTPGVYDLARGSKVISQEDLIKLTSQYAIGMPALVPVGGLGGSDLSELKNGLQGIRNAIESQPVAAINVNGSGITRLVATGNARQIFIDNFVI